MHTSSGTAAQWTVGVGRICLHPVTERWSPRSDRSGARYCDDASVHAPRRSHPLTQQRILLADDEPRLLHVVGLYLSMEGFEVREASDGTEALSMLETEEFDLAILDVMMPGVDGIEVCRHIRSQPGTQSMPVLVVTSLSSDKDVERARLAGANHLITKPFSLPGLGAVGRSCFEDAPALTGRSAQAIALLK